jgi:uncharacterized protein (TIGR04255 family)
MPKNVEKPKPYTKPPIIEAVIEVRFADTLNQKQLDTLLAKKKTKFAAQQLQDIDIKINNATLSASAEKKSIWYKLIDNDDVSNIVQIKSNALSISRLPLYEGWEILLEKFKTSYDWYTHKKFKPLSRIGVRYINRIDIPLTNGKIELEDYFNIFPHVPKENFPDLNRFLMQTVSQIEGDRILTINVHSTENILLNHVSIVFDIDVSQTDNLPINSTKLYKVLDEIRVQKDGFFENLLKKKCKELFD